MKTICARGLFKPLETFVCYVGRFSWLCANCNGVPCVCNGIGIEDEILVLALAGGLA
jgi:hypothetical protein